MGILGFRDFGIFGSPVARIPKSQNPTKSQNKNKRFCVFFGFWEIIQITKRRKTSYLFVWDFGNLWETCSQNPKIQKSQNPKTKVKRFCVFLTFWEITQVPKRRNTSYLFLGFWDCWETCSQNPKILKSKNPKILKQK